jgi:biopolymer transport protein ExbD
MIPLIDLVFLTLGAIVALLTQMELVRSIPVDLARVGAGSQFVTHGEFDVIAVTHEGVTFNDEPTTLDRLAWLAGGADVVLRVERSLESEAMLRVLAELSRAGSTVRIEVSEKGRPKGR